MKRTKFGIILMASTTVKLALTLWLPINMDILYNIYFSSPFLYGYPNTTGTSVIKEKHQKKPSPSPQIFCQVRGHQYGFVPRASANVYPTLIVLFNNKLSAIIFIIFLHGR
jgi:hypothetical protein